MPNSDREVLSWLQTLVLLGAWRTGVQTTRVIAEVFGLLTVLKRAYEFLPTLRQNLRS
jgi:hypothetical protein